MARSQDRRRVARVSLLGRLNTQVRKNLAVRLLDLSSLGARIEHSDLLRPGAFCAFELPPTLGSLALSARVIWSSVVGGKHTSDGERHLIYQSGLAFVDLTAEQQAALANVLQRLRVHALGLDESAHRTKGDADEP